jgi:leucyl aminopeptidase (aminopeptidase T)
MNTDDSLRMEAVFKKIVKDSAKILPNDFVCVVTDTNKLNIARAVASASRASGAETVLVEMSPRETHGNEPPAMVSAAMAKSTVMFTPTTYAITHTQAFKEALKNGSRGIVLRGVTEDIVLGEAMKVDYRALKYKCEKLASFLRKSSTVRVTSSSGTQIEFKIKDRPVRVLSGIASEPGQFAALPDGEVPVSPLEGTANGKIVFDTTMDALGALDSPIEVEVLNGMLQTIKGGSQADRLAQIVEHAGECGRNIAEFAIGTNGAARIIGNMAEDKKKEGTVHIALGGNHVLGGTYPCSIHLDGLIRFPSVFVDGVEIVDNGKLLWEKL